MREQASVIVTNTTPLIALTAATGTSSDLDIAVAADHPLTVAQSPSKTAFRKRSVYVYFFGG